MKKSETHVRISTSLHEKMKEMAKSNGRLIQDEYKIALEKYIANEKQEIILADSKIEKQFNEKIDKVDKHLASMLGRSGMDTSMILMGLLNLLEHLFDTDKADIMYQLRKDAARYYTNKSSYNERDVE